MNNFHGADFTLPKEWPEKLLKAPKVEALGSTSMFLSSLLKALKMTQAELSGKLQVDSRTISRWVHGTAHPRGRSRPGEILDDWKRQIYIIQNYSPEQWHLMISSLSLGRSWEEPSL